jgi:DNA-binding HxlR family transcriptional regulator
MKMLDDRLCPQVEAAFALVAKKWAGLIVFLLYQSEKRFSEIKAAIPQLSARVLSQRMRDLEKAGLVLRQVKETTPVGVSYKLTEKGEGLALMMDGIACWARKYNTPSEK